MKVRPDSVCKRLSQAWNRSLTEIRHLSTLTRVTPNKGTDIFEEDKTSPIKNAMSFEMKPVVFELSQRTKQSKSHELFVVLSGNLSFELPVELENLITKSYTTRIEYFRKRDKKLQFLGAVHYDFECEVHDRSEEEKHGFHPKFHSQFSNSIEKFPETYLNRHYRDVQEFCNYLTNIRIPTLQLDCFAALYQLCADHLLDKSNCKIFNKINKHCNFFRSATHPLQINGNLTCIRSLHFYTSQKQH